MATSSEDVLLLVNNVRHQKKNGTLYLMDRRLAWIMDGKDVFSVSQSYADIKTQKISPDGKAKVQLQVVLHDAGAVTFHFTNPLGSETQLKDRNDVKELLQQLLPKFKRKINKDLEDKNRILTDNPDLLQLYRDLVTSQIITPEEFWNVHVAERQLNKSSKQVQEVGVSGAFLADVKPQVDGCNGLKYNLNADLIRSIFKTYPAVKRKHLEYVPDKISESEFWTRFFQSHYFHRDRINSGNKDVFSECAKLDEQDIRNELQKTLGDPLHDVTSFTDSSLDDGYGVGTRDGPSTVNIANKNLIRRFNHYSMMILKASESALPMNSEEPAESTPNGASANGVKDADEPHAKRAKVIEKTIYEDLGGNNEQKGVELSFQKKERYLHGPTPLGADTEMLSNEDLTNSAAKMQHDLHQWRRNLVQVLPSKVAVSVLKELSPGGALMKASTSDRSEQLAPEVREEFQNLYSALVELLRHFWSCFPVTTKIQDEKAVRMRDALERFEYAKLKPFQDQLLRDHFQTNLTDHMKHMIEAAYAKYHNWVTKRTHIKL